MVTNCDKIVTSQVYDNDLEEPSGHEVYNRYIWSSKQELIQLIQENGGLWETKVYHFKDGHGCPHCAGRPTYTINNMHDIGKNK